VAREMAGGPNVAQRAVLDHGSHVQSADARKFSTRAANIKAEHGPEKIDLEASTLEHVSTGTKNPRTSPVRDISAIRIGGGCALICISGERALERRRFPWRNQALRNAPHVSWAVTLPLCAFVGTFPTVLLSDDMDSTPAAIPISRRGREKSSARPAAAARVGRGPCWRPASQPRSAARSAPNASRAARDLALDIMRELARAGFGEIHAVIGAQPVGGLVSFGHNPLAQICPKMP
jgi:hypothetical protein